VLSLNKEALGEFYDRSGKDKALIHKLSELDAIGRQIDWLARIPSTEHGLLMPPTNPTSPTQCYLQVPGGGGNGPTEIRYTDPNRVEAAIKLFQSARSDIIAEIEETHPELLTQSDGTP